MSLFKKFTSLFRVETARPQPQSDAGDSELVRVDIVERQAISASWESLLDQRRRTGSASGSLRNSFRSRTTRTILRPLLRESKGTPSVICLERRRGRSIA